MSDGARVLLVDDDPDVVRSIALLLDREQIALEGASSPEQAYSLLALNRYDAILLDLNFSKGRTQGEEGFDCLNRILSDDPDQAVIVITAHSGIRIAVAAMRAGALDFVIKPWRNDELRERVRAAIDHRRRREQLVEARRDQGGEEDAPRLLGESPAIRRVREQLRQIGPTVVNTLILGPAGSGRSLVARLLHAASPRVGADIVSLDARRAADPHDAMAQDRLAAAQGGTLLLRNIDALDEDTQAVLLDLLPADIRLIATADKADGLTSGARVRIGVVEIAMPALRNRKGDAVILARHFAAAAARRHGRPAAPFTEAAERLILETVWPDEVEGLARAVERAVVLNRGSAIDAPALAPATVDDPPTATPTLEERERQQVEEALAQHGFNVSRAASSLGLTRFALYRRMAKYGL